LADLPATSETHGVLVAGGVDLATVAAIMGHNGYKDANALRAVFALPPRGRPWGPSASPLKQAGWRPAG
jgi:hypothetical protein